VAKIGSFSVTLLVTKMYKIANFDAKLYIMHKNCQYKLNFFRALDIILTSRGMGQWE